MEQQVLLQLAQKEILEKFITNYNKDGKDRRTQKYYHKRINDFQELWNDALTRHRNLLVLKFSDPNKAQELGYFRDDIFSQMESFFVKNFTAIEERLENEYPISSKSTFTASEQETQSKVVAVRQKCEDALKLPKISLEKFYGDYKKWPAFHDLFKTLVHENESLHGVQKLQYLKLHLGGEAENLLRHFQVTESNYETAWKVLKDRYNNKRVLVNTVLKALLSQNTVAHETPQGIKALLDTTTECLHALENLEIDIKNWDVLIVYLIVQRLPSETHQLWEQSLSSRKDLPSWEELKEFLNCRFRTLEAITSRKITSSKDYRNSISKPKPSTQAFVAVSSAICCICAGDHSIRQCSNFASMSTSQRLQVAKSKGLCLNCLGFGHMLARCPSQQRCFHCKQRHHSLLHRNQQDSTASRPGRFINQRSTISSANNEPTTSAAVNNSQTQSFLSASSPPFKPYSLEESTSKVNSYVISDSYRNREILLATALVRLVAPSGQEQVVRALIDQGSQASFVSEATVQALRLPKETIRAEVSGVGQTNAGQVTARVHLMLKPQDDDKMTVEATGLVLKKLTHLLPSRKIQNADWKHLHRVKLADPSYYEPGKVDLLLGADVYSQIIQGGLIKGNIGEPIAQQTLFGWILSGEIVSSSRKKISISNFHIVANLDKELTRFWEIEDLPTKKILSEEEKKCEEIFANTHRRLKDGRYEVAIPFVDSTKTKYLGKSRTGAVSRLIQMESRFKKNTSLQLEYVKCLKEYLTLGHMEELQEKERYIEQNEFTVYKHTYLPHHAVTKDDSATTKLRVVFDGSKKTSNGTSLNDIMLKGPTIQDELACLLLRWRKHKIAFTADIEKMYRQIRVRPEHAEYQRIVWRESINEPIKDYKLLTVTFGTRSAPYLATRVLQQLALDEKERYPIGSQAVLQEFYVDDLLSGAENLEEAQEKQQQLTDLLTSGGFNLRKWASNSSKLLTNTSESHQDNNTSFHINASDQIKALGLYWNPVNDNLCYAIKFPEQQGIVTKRTILSDVAKLFDPLGWVAPCIIVAKMLIQKLWLEKLDWDETVSENIEIEWRNFREKLRELGTITLPRWVHLSKSHTNVEIHGFCDASTMAYAAATYICVIDVQGNKRVSLLSAKRKVAPIQTVSLPRLELCGAVLLAKLLKYVTESLQLSNYTTYAWTDSEIVLAWLKSHPSKWKTFIANRVSHIHELTREAMWRHVPSKENPADCATRGLLPSELKTQSLWWNGPSWLEKSKSSWPKQKDIPATNLETRKTLVTCTQISSNKMEANYSSLTKLTRITAYCYRFKSKLKGLIRATELHEALMLWLRKIQAEHFSEETTALKHGKIVKTGRLIKLTPFLHSDGLLRVGGRLRFSELSFDEKFPIILPDKCHLTTLILDKIHKDTMHGGSQLMMRVLAKKYWLLNARNATRFHVHRCVICQKQRAKVQTQLMGNLPRPRVTMSRPFAHTGMDYCGPFEIRRNRGRGSKTYKGYICIFVCMAVKAIHLEVVTDLSAQGFVAAFRRFTARRGLCSDIYCDCGTNFIGGNSILTRQRQQMINELDSEIASIIENEGVNFHFNPPGSPNFGGLWEAGVKSTKFHMKRIIGNATLTYEELNTVLTQIEACLNSRPLYAMSNDPSDTTALTPAHFLIGDILLTPPEPSILDENIRRIDRWQYIQHLYQSFWKKWNSEYLCRLQQRPKWMQKQQNLRVGDLVIIKQENLPPSRWLLARVLETHPGTDGLVRVVTVKTKDSILKRSVSKICRLPIEPVVIETHVGQNREF